MLLGFGPAAPAAPAALAAPTEPATPTAPPPPPSGSHRAARQLMSSGRFAPTSGSWLPAPSGSPLGLGCSPSCTSSSAPAARYLMGALCLALTPWLRRLEPERGEAPVDEPGGLPTAVPTDPPPPLPHAACDATPPGARGFAGAARPPEVGGEAAGTIPTRPRGEAAAAAGAPALGAPAAPPCWSATSRSASTLPDPTPSRPATPARWAVGEPRAASGGGGRGGGSGSSAAPGSATAAAAAPPAR
ncbi:MAG: hypothetical protein J3K34DRAFT_439763 [Monoraphidium minutum]|nr:MAG: hypothetical protein J3K34DRAFT_439763 [Monoraphidium minutum]